MRTLASWLPLLAMLPAQAEISRAGRSCSLTVHAGSHDQGLAARLADEGLAAVERLRAQLERWQVRPPAPLALHLHLEARSFRAAEAGAHPYPNLVEDFARDDASEAHVLLWPPVAAPILGQIGLPPYTEAELQRCAAGLAAMQIAEAARRDRWLADVFAYGVIDALRNPRGGYGVDPAFDARRSMYARHHAEGNDSSFAWILDDVAPVRARSDLLRRVQTATATAQLFASTGSGWLRKLLAKPKAPMTTVATRRWLAEAILGKDTVKHDQRFGRMIASLQPAWPDVGPGVGTRDGRVVLAGAVDHAAGMLAVPPAGPYVVRGTATIAAGAQRELRVALLVDDERSLVVAFVVGRGCSTHRRRPDGKGYEQLQLAPAALELGRPFAFAVEVDGEVRVRIGGELVLTQPLDGPAPRRACGFATNDSAVIVEAPRCEPLLPAKK